MSFAVLVVVEMRKHGVYDIYNVCLKCETCSKLLQEIWRICEEKDNPTPIILFLKSIKECLKVAKK
ncbi:MAG: hypothetical protein DRN49_01270 [Thaumarchaeota archaeon]|nr:MAG: hypothetical protein DRN49_01270 [Nitrososphaerota archaeon]